MTKPHIPLDEIRAQVEGCRKCPLADGRTQTVFGVGNPEARVMIIGEAPGKNEDLQGEPFVGAESSSAEIVSVLPAALLTACAVILVCVVVPLVVVLSLVVVCPVVVVDRKSVV